MEKNNDINVLDLVKHCGTDEFANIISNVIKRLDDYGGEFDFKSDDAGGISGYVTRKATGKRCYVVAVQYDTQEVGMNEFTALTDTLISEFLDDGIFITTSSFSKEVASLVKKSDLNILLINGVSLMNYLSEDDLSKWAVNKDDEEAEQPKRHTYDENLRERNSRSKLRITFSDGTVFCDTSATRTMMQAIEHIGIEKVKSLGMESCHIPLISNQIVPKYKEWLKPIGDGYYLMTQSNTDQKFLQLTAIKNQLNLDFNIEMGTDFNVVSKIGANDKKQAGKTHLVITFDDGTKIGGDAHEEPFLLAIEHIGIEKVAHSQIMLYSKPLITQTKQNNRQQQMSNGQWLTIPGTTKDKYKSMRVIAAVVHVKLNVEIV
jgi:hypothetical protein